MMQDNPEKLFAFEYQEAGGNFYYNMDGNTQQQNTAGYRTICFTTMEEWDPFNKMIQKRYDFCKSVRHLPPTFEQIKQEWEWYLELKEDIENIGK